MGARRDGMQDVELVELHDGGARGGAGPDGSASSESSPSLAVRGAVRVGRWARRRWPVLAVAVVVVALVIGGVRVQHARAERAYLASIAGMPGILEPLDASTREIWRAETGLDLGTQWIDAGDVLVGAVQNAEGIRVVALDALTGAVRWDVSAPGTVQTDGYGSLACVTTGPAAAPLIVCVTGLAWESDEDGDPVPGATQQDVVVVDVERGEVVGQHAVDAQVTLAQVGEDVAVAEAQPDGHVRGTLRDPVTWDAVWTFDGEVPVEPVDEPTDDEIRFPDEVRVVAVDGRVAFSDRSGAVTVLSESGEVLDQLPGVEGGSLLFVAAGRMVRYEWRSSDDLGTILDLASGRTFENGGLYDATSDGSLRPRLLVADDRGLSLLDVDTGESTTLDAGGVEGVWSTFLVRGQVLIEHFETADGAGAGLAAYDGTTGELRWRTALRVGLSDGLYSTRLTDGRYVLLIDTAEESDGEASDGEEGPEWRLAAFSTTDGHRAWELDVPEEVEQFVELGGHLYATGGSGVVVAFG